MTETTSNEKLHQVKNGFLEKAKALEDSDSAFHQGARHAYCEAAGVLASTIDDAQGDISRIPYGEEEDVEDDGTVLYVARDADRCHDCRAEPGELHEPGCDVEQCPICGHQLISCPHTSEILPQD